MPGRIALMILLLLAGSWRLGAQQPKDSLDYSILADTTSLDYDELFSELERFIDSITAPRNMTLISISAVSSYFNYESKDDFLLRTDRSLMYMPSMAFYSKMGWGVSVASAVVHDGEKLNPFQFLATGSYDYIPAKRAFITGLSYTRYFTRDSLPFYTSPLKNEIYAYFLYRRPWIRPGITLSYGWGSRRDYRQREEYINSLLLRPTGYTRINTQESIADFHITLSLRHDFYWLGTIARRDHIRLTPQINFINGTQQFGLNQTSNTYATSTATGAGILYNTENVYLDNQLYFQPLSLAAILKLEYGIGKFFLQPQLFSSYYFPAKDNNLSTTVVLNAGVIF